MQTPVDIARSVSSRKLAPKKGGSRIGFIVETTPLDERLAQFAQVRPGWEDCLRDDTDFVNTAFETAAKVARGELAADAARKYPSNLAREK